MNPQTPPTETQSVQVMRIVWFALLATQFILAFVAFFIVPPQEIIGDPINPQIFLAFGAMVVIASYVVPNVLSKSLNIPANEVNITTLFTPFIISLVLSEACAMMGFMTKTITNNDQIAVALFILSLLAFLTRFPVESKLRDQVEQLKNLKAK
jgi:F0F1-type ATP synthase membrane subunit c/vacuolar-type H+-ATPase subunit K